jgi:hypothetical protein
MCRAEVKIVGISTLNSGTITQDIGCEFSEAFFIHDSDIKAMRAALLDVAFGIQDAF